MDSFRTSILVRLSTLVYAVFLLVVSTGATLSIHFCNGNVIDFAIDNRAEVCEGYIANTDSFTGGCSVSKKGCCEDDDRLLVFENDYPPNDLSGNLNKLSCADLMGQKRIEQTQVDSQLEECLGNPPPLIQTDYQVLFQTFLI